MGWCWCYVEKIWLIFIYMLYIDVIFKEMECNCIDLYMCYFDVIFKGWVNVESCCLMLKVVKLMLMLLFWLKNKFKLFLWFKKKWVNVDVIFKKWVCWVL